MAGSAREVDCARRLARNVTLKSRLEESLCCSGSDPLVSSRAVQPPEAAWGDAWPCASTPLCSAQEMSTEYMAKRGAGLVQHCAHRAPSDEEGSELHGA